MKTYEWFAKIIVKVIMLIVLNLVLILIACLSVVEYSPNAPSVSFQLEIEWMVIFLDCSCNSNCPNGCDGCPNPICACGEILLLKIKITWIFVFARTVWNWVTVINIVMVTPNVEHHVGKFSSQNMSHVHVRWVQKWPLMTFKISFSDWLLRWMPMWGISMWTWQKVFVGAKYARFQ